MILTNDSSTSKDPLVICYCCWSRALNSSFTLLRQAIKEKFEKLEKTEITDLYFEYFHGNSKKREIVENEFHFNMLVNNIQLNNKQEHTINYLKVQVKGKKAYGLIQDFNKHRRVIRPKLLHGGTWKESEEDIHALLKKSSMS
ncbi:hypothetical protein GLOIN_2v1869411 [Rhizophagus irregularis DAOM 181602=DAOM 197198]|nr:hypothetical protein GLOIN_2v1869411 [Rhizophagus irregularis DAOM 181602=DAOM 197198]